MITDEKYQTYSMYTPGSKEIPEEHLNHIINIMVEDAALNMGCSYEKKMVDRIIEFIKSRDFNYMPLSIVASAIARGSLGKFGPGRLVPRTVHEWLEVAAAEYRQQRIHDNLQESLKEKPISVDLHEYPLGQAINLKADWLRSGNISEDEYDRIPLKEVAERVGKGLPVVPEIFGIKSRNKETA